MRVRNKNDKGVSSSIGNDGFTTTSTIGGG